MSTVVKQQNGRVLEIFKLWAQSIIALILCTAFQITIYKNVTFLNPYLAASLQGAFFVLSFALIHRLYFKHCIFTSDLSLRRIGSPGFVQSLKFSIPVIISLLPSIFLPVGNVVMNPNWKQGILLNLFHSSVSEEILFRAIIFRIFLKKLSLRQAALFSSMIFAAMHFNRVFSSTGALQVAFNLGRVAVAFSSGYALALIYQRFKFNLWIPIALHFVLNGLGLFTAQDNLTAIFLNVLGLAISFSWIVRACSQEHVNRRIWS